MVDFSSKSPLMTLEGNHSGTQPGYDIHSLPWEMDDGPNRNRWFKLKNGDFPWRTVSHNQMVITNIFHSYSILHRQPIV